MALRTPKYRLHRPSGLAVVTIGGRDHYLGPHGSKESMAEFDRLVGEWMVRGRPDARAASANDRTINEILVDYLRYAEIYYRKPDGRQANQTDCCELALRPLRAMHFHTLTDLLSPLGHKRCGNK